METSWLNSFVGQRVTAVTGAAAGEHSDSGILLQIGEGWLQIAKENGENVLIPNSAVRVVKLLDMTKTVGVTGTAGAAPAPQTDPDAPLNNPANPRFPDGY